MSSNKPSYLSLSRSLIDELSKSENLIDKFYENSIESCNNSPFDLSPTNRSNYFSNEANLPNEFKPSTMLTSNLSLVSSNEFETIGKLSTNNQSIINVNGNKNDCNCEFENLLNLAQSVYESCCLQNLPSKCFKFNYN